MEGKWSLKQLDASLWRVDALLSNYMPLWRVYDLLSNYMPLNGG